MKSKSFARVTTILSVGVISLLVFTIALAAAQLIDSFSAGNPNLVANSGTPDVEDYVSDSSILGIERDILAHFDNGDSVIVRAGPVVGNILFFSLGISSNGTAQIVYDGEDGIADIDPSGLCDPGCVDLTGGGSNDGIHFEVAFSDQTLPVYFRIYSGSLVDYEEYTLTLPGAIPFPSHVDFKIPFAGFNSVGNGASFDNVGAIEVFIDGSNADGAKLVVDFFEADNFKDFGDAPGSYGTASHSPNGQWLGANVDIEDSQQTSADARGDDIHQLPGDEDGVTRTAGFNWSIANGGSVDVTTNGCSIALPCYLSAWVDWDALTPQFDAGEQILDDYEITDDGPQSIPFAIGGAPAFDTSYFARFRLCNAQGVCNTPTGNSPSGEVEDYQWTFGPNAITLSGFDARSSSPSILLVGIPVLVVLIILGAIFYTRKQARKTA